ncbi:putative phosphoribosylaminoimidazole-succinocarboxamide synthase [Kalymmatonema gypsitolerans NIES-4073]|nr:putative phosphoribosylaminoimidazole-succinocarboxamide synthase [Scytonema sp. NIES-4073]
MSLQIKKVEHIASGKVREIYALDDKHLAIITTDRISAYDVVLHEQIPDKGRVLNQLSLFWTEMFSSITSTHLMTATNQKITTLLAELGKPSWLQDRTMIVRRAEMFPIECIVRSYLAGSAWREYAANGQIAGLKLPKGLQLAEKLPHPIFTPSTKSKDGHDQNITFEEARRLVGDAIDELARISLELYIQAASYAEARGVIIADTKFEFGIVDGQIVLADEVLTPDSSRFWYEKDWLLGTNPPSLDKQFVRDWLDASGWNHTPPPPKLPNEIIQATRMRYIEAYKVLTGKPWFKDDIKES